MEIQCKTAELLKIIPEVTNSHYCDFTACLEQVDGQINCGISIKVNIKLHILEESLIIDAEAFSLMEWYYFRLIQSAFQGQPDTLCFSLIDFGPKAIFYVNSSRFLLFCLKFSVTKSCLLCV